MKTITELNEWQQLAEHAKSLSNQTLRYRFTKEHDRFQQFSISHQSLFLDYSRNHVTAETLTLFEALAKAVGLQDKIEAFFTGQPINHTEKRPALHTALRNFSSEPFLLHGQNINDQIKETQARCAALVKAIHQKEWLGTTGKPIEHVVNIGIGGSYTGPMMTIDALQDFAICELQFHFICTVDPYHIQDVLKKIDPETTLFIISSKSFTTIETLTNAQTVLAWMQQRLNQPLSAILKHHVLAVTAAKEKALSFGIPATNILPLWEWVGGRYSVWSAIGLPLMLKIGNDHFANFLRGAYEMDLHFRHTPLQQNIPFILGMLGIWYRNFFNAPAQAIIPYSYRLRYLIPYLQQADMESNGKRINLQGKAVSYPTGPILFGEEGCVGQHAYHQLLHQGQHFIPVDFLFVGKTPNQSYDDLQQDLLLASGISQAQALMRGKTMEEARESLLAKQAEAADSLAEHQVIPGNKSSNILFMQELSPKNLGMMLALYEHKIFVQGVIWQINSFDQWGVELGKQLLPDILRCVQKGEQTGFIDTATVDLIEKMKKMQGAA